jgi:hypothetical protein
MFTKVERKRTQKPTKYLSGGET